MNNKKEFNFDPVFTNLTFTEKVKVKRELKKWDNYLSENLNVNSLSIKYERLNDAEYEIIDSILAEQIIEVCGPCLRSVNLTDNYNELKSDEFGISFDIGNNRLKIIEVVPLSTFLRILSDKCKYLHVLSVAFDASQLNLVALCSLLRSSANLKHLTISSKCNPEDCQNIFNSMPNTIEELCLREMNVQFIRNLATNLTNLQSLQLYECKISNENIESLRLNAKNLLKLSLTEAKTNKICTSEYISENAMKNIAQLVYLEELDINGFKNAVTDSFIDILARHCKKLAILSLNSSAITNWGADILVSKFRNLESLHLQNLEISKFIDFNYEIPLMSLEVLKCPKISTFEIIRMLISAKRIRHLKLEYQLVDELLLDFLITTSLHNYDCFILEEELGNNQLRKIQVHNGHWCSSISLYICLGQKINDNAPLNMYNLDIENFIAKHVMQYFANYKMHSNISRVI